MQREEIVKSYFQAWLDQNVESLKNIFSEDAIYSEYYGPVYHGLPQILKWFDEWNNNGKVLKWDIQRFIHQDLLTVVEWTLENNYNDEIGRIDGVSIFEFNADQKIVSVKEFQSKSEHNYPYE